jgi:hypothetical protein
VGYLVFILYQLPVTRHGGCDALTPGFELRAKFFECFLFAAISNASHNVTGQASNQIAFFQRKRQLSDHIPNNRHESVPILKTKRSQFMTPPTDFHRIPKPHFVGKTRFP